MSGMSGRFKRVEASTLRAVRWQTTSVRYAKIIKKGNDMNKKEFCDQYTQFYGEEVDDIKQIDTILFDGGELLRLVNHMINHSSKRQVGALVRHLGLSVNGDEDVEWTKQMINGYEIITGYTINKRASGL